MLRPNFSSVANSRLAFAGAPTRSARRGPSHIQLLDVPGIMHVQAPRASNGSTASDDGGGGGDSADWADGLQPGPSMSSASFSGQSLSLSIDDLAPPYMPDPPDLMGKKARSRWNASHFAFLGDAVWELHMRRHFFYPPSRNTVYSQLVAAEARAETQSHYYNQLVESTFLSEDEMDVLRWARNAKLQNFPKRFKSARSDEVAVGADPRLVYRNASCLEALVGFLYVTAPSRLQQLLNFLGLGEAGDMT